MPKAPFGARAWRRPVGRSILSTITRIPAKFTIPGPFGHEIGQLADLMTRRTRDCSPDAMGVVPTRGRDTPIAISARRSRGSPDQGCRHGGRRGRETHRRPHISAMLPMLREPGSAHYGTTDRPGTPAPVRDTTRPTWACARSVALGRSVMMRTCIKRPRARSERPGLEALPPDPRDPDLVRAKHSRGPRHSNLDQTGLLDTKARCRYG